MSGFFGGSNAKKENQITSLQVQTSAYGRVIPVVYGTTRISFNLLWFDNFQQHGGGSKK